MVPSDDIVTRAGCSIEGGSDDGAATDADLATMSDDGFVC